MSTVEEEKGQPNQHTYVTAVDRVVRLMDEIYEGTVKVDETEEHLLKICSVASGHLIKFREHSKDLVEALQLSRGTGRYYGGNSPHTH